MRKRTVAAILKDNASGSSSSTPNQPSTEHIKIATRKPRTKVQCYCSKCNGKLVDPRTKQAHEKTSLELLNSEPLDSEPLDLDSDSEQIFPNETPMSQLLVESFDLTTIGTHSTQPMIVDDNDLYEEQIFTFLPRKKRVKTSTFQSITTVKSIESVSEDSENSDDNISSEYITEDDDNIHTDESSENDITDDENHEDEYSEYFEDYSHPTFDSPRTSEIPKTDQFTWILIWIMKFRSNYKLSDSATEALIKFIKLLLKECENPEHNSFPKSLYMARKTLGLADRFKCFAACRTCHKLYKKEVE